MSKFAKIFRNLTHVAVGRGLMAGLAFFQVAYMSRQWEPALVGDYSTLLGYFVMFQQLPMLGLHILLSRDAATGERSVSINASNALTLAFTAATLLAMGIYAIGWQLYSPELQTGFLIVAVSLLPTAIISMSEATLNGQERISIVARCNLLELTLRTAGTLLALYYKLGLIPVLQIFLLGRLITAYVYLAGAGISRILLLQLINRANLKYLTDQVPRFFTVMAFSALINRVDVVMLSKLGSSAAVGIYSMPYKIYELVQMAPTIFTLVLFPVFAGYYKTDHKAFQKLAQMVVLFNFAVGVPLTIVVALLAKPIVLLLFGPNYLDSVPILQILLFGALFYTVDKLFTMILMSSNRQKYEARVLVLTFICYASLLYYQIGQSGALGAALATLETMVIQCVLKAIAARPVFVLRGLPRLAAAALIAGAFMLFTIISLDDKPLLAVPLSLLGYLFIMLTLSGVNSRKLREVLALVKRRKA